MTDPTSNPHERIVALASILAKGWWFYFNLGPHQIAVHNSAWTGIERVFVNDEQVARKISILTRSRIPFRLDDRDFTVELRVVDFWTNPRMECLLFEGDQEIAHERLAYSPSSRPKSKPYAFLIAAVMGGAGVLVGYAVGKLLAGV
jgi:hypothetical protein